MDKKIQCIDGGFKQTLDMLPGIWCIIDMESRFVYYNNEFAVLGCIENLCSDFLIGKTGESIPKGHGNSADHFWSTDGLIIESKKMQKLLHCFQIQNDNWVIMEIDKKPILNSDNEVEAVILKFTDKSTDKSLDLALAVASHHKDKINLTQNIPYLINLDKSLTKISLKPKESECLFYLTRGFSYKNIAELQKVSYRTVVNHVNKIRIKFDASTTDDLISKTFFSGYSIPIPKNVFSQRIVIILPC